MISKPVMIAGVSTGVLGTVRAQMHLRVDIEFRRSHLTMPGNEVYQQIEDKIDENGMMHQPTIKFLDDNNNFIQWANKINS